MRRSRLTYLSVEKLRALERAVDAAAKVGGDFIEAGVALGGSGIVIASRMPEDRAFHGFDVFGMIPPTTGRDDEVAHERYEVIRSGRSSGIGGDRYYGYVDDLYSNVVGNFARFGLAVDGRRIVLHRGLFHETLRLNGPVAFAHLDCDWFDPVSYSLREIWPRVSEGGYIVVDDYHDYGGCRDAVDEFLANASGVNVVATEPSLVLARN